MTTYNYQDVKRGELTAFFGFASAILFALLLTWVSGCEHGANIPIDVDPCMIEGVEECSPACEVCEDRDRFELQLRNARRSGFDHGFREGQESCFEFCGALVTCNEAQARQDGFDLGYQNGLDNAWNEIGDLCDDEDSDTDRGHR